MKLKFTLVEPVTDTRTTVDLVADGSAPLGEIMEVLAPVQPADGDLYVGSTRLEPSQRLDESPLLDGALVGAGDQVMPVWDEDLVAPYELRIVGGVTAGTIFRLQPGDFSIGRGDDATIQVATDDLSRNHVRVSIGSDGQVRWEDLGSTNGTFIDGTRLTGPTPADFGQVVRAGSTLLTIEQTDTHRVELFPDKETGQRLINVSPRLASSTNPVEVRLEAAPEKADPSKFPIFMLIAPLVMAGGLAAFTRSPTYLLFGLMSPVMYIGSHFQSKRSSTRSHQKELDRWEKRNLAEQTRLKSALQSEMRRRREETPDPATVVLATRGPRQRLWERQPDDPRFCWIRVGTGQVPSLAKVTRNNSASEPAMLYDAPVALSILQAGVVGIAGTSQQTESLARWIALQLAALHSPDELNLVVLADTNALDWEWVRWIPHARFSDSSAVAVGNTADTVQARVKELAALVDARRSENPGLGAVGPRFPLVVAILDGASRLRGIPGVTDVLLKGPEVGVYAVCIDQNERLLPQEARATLVFGADATLRVQVAGNEATEGVLADGVSQAIADLCSRAMAPLRKVGGGAANVAGSLPGSLRLLDAIGMTDPTADQIAARWRTSGHSSRCVIGRTAAGDFSIDIAHDGPHGLVAGTTGAGKSEFLMSFIASLAISNRPDAFNFVLVDYKGGTAFKDCARLPHTSGMVTNLDAHLTERALVSLRAEITRREALFRDVGAKEIENYWEVEAHANGSIPAMPRLLIVIDEFAILARELPTFVGGLIEIAQLGRAFGVHLILATQRPSGAVSPDIRANSDLRVALRTKEPTDSMDVIDAPDAARIGKAFPGRGFMRSGQEPLVQFQSGRVGGRRPGAVAVVRSVPTVRIAPWDQAGIPQSDDQRSSSVAADEDDAETDLHYIVESIIAATQQEAIATPASPLLPELPAIVTLDELPTRTTQAPTSNPLDIPFGLEDLPEVQQQVPAYFRLGEGHVGVGGSARSGRTSFLRIIAASIARSHWSSDVHLFGIDCGNQGLSLLTQLPHCGAVANRTEPDRVARLLDRLNKEITKRQAILTSLGVSDIVEQRGVTGSDPLPFMVVLIDRWEGFLESLAEIENGKLKEQVLRLLKEGQSLGIQVVIAGDRYALYGEVGSLMQHRLALPFNDREEYSFADIRARDLPDQILPGRVFRSVSQSELQVAVLDQDLGGLAQNDAFRRLAEWVSQRDIEVPPSSRPFAIGTMPVSVAMQDHVGSRPPNMRMPLFVGLGGEQVEPCWVDLAEDGPAFVVGGPPRSGKSTALCAFARQLIDQGVEIVVVAPKKSPLAALAGEPGVRAAFLGADAESADIEESIAVKPIAVLVDDADLVDTANDHLIALASRRMGDSALIVAGTTEFMRGGSYKSFVADARKSRCGLLLWPESNFDGQLLSVTLPRGTVITAPSGRGFLGVGGDYSLVQAAQPS